VATTVSVRDDGEPTPLTIFSTEALKVVDRSDLPNELHDQI